MGGDVESVLKQVGLAEDEGSESSGGQGEKGKKKQEDERVWLHCIVGGKLDEKKAEEGDEEEVCSVPCSLRVELNVGQTTAPRRRGFDVLIDAGLSPADVANMRRQFYESRGEEVPEGLDVGDVSELHSARKKLALLCADQSDDEHARALEEQWIEGDLTAETATSE